MGRKEEKLFWDETKGRNEKRREKGKGMWEGCKEEIKRRDEK